MEILTLHVLILVFIQRFDLNQNSNDFYFNIQTEGIMSSMEESANVKRNATIFHLLFDDAVR